MSILEMNLSLGNIRNRRVSKSSTEAEYHSISSACSEVVWIWRLLDELGFPQHIATTLHVDNTIELLNVSRKNKVY